MNTSNMKNIVILKELPSNLVEEAIIFLKENKNVKKLNLVDNEINVKLEKEKYLKTNKKIESKKYIIDEAQMVISDYISKIENRNKNESYKKINKKYKKVKKINSILTVCLLISIIINFII